MAWVELVEGWQLVEGARMSATRVFVERDDGTATLPVAGDVHPDNPDLGVTEITTTYVGSDDDRQRKQITYALIPPGGGWYTPSVEGIDGGLRREARMSTEVLRLQLNPGETDPWYWYKAGAGNVNDDKVPGDRDFFRTGAKISESIDLVIYDYPTLRASARLCIGKVNAEHLDPAFLVAQKETVLFTGYSANVTYNSENKLRWNVRLNFENRYVTHTAGLWGDGSSKDGWNYEPNDVGAWDKIVRTGHTGLYPTVNMAPLLALQ